MSVERYGGQIEIQCDKCTETFGPYSSGDFHEMIADARNKGWAVYKVKGDWVHKCPLCTKPSAAEDFA